jgi:NAD+-dependent protein deacetylase SIR2
LGNRLAFLLKSFTRNRVDIVVGQLPPNFFGSIGQLNEADLLIVIGTSLTVHPFASLANMVTGQCPRVLINLDKVGEIGSGKNDIVLLGKCDDIIRDLAKELGWEDELDKEWTATAGSLDTHEATPDAPAKAEDLTDESRLDRELEKIVDKVAGALTVSDNDKPGVKADESIRDSSGTSEDVKAKEGTNAQPKTPQRDPEEGKRSSEPLAEVKGLP